MRRIVYVSGTRADFGLMRRTLQAIHHDARLELGLCVTGMHLLSEYGQTVSEIEATGLTILARIPVTLDGSSGATMARALAAELDGMVEVFDRCAPDIVRVLGDRGEMLAAAIAALHLNIPVVHIHGGELSGTVDEPVRHAISKLSHYHFTSTEGARERLIRMGEHSTSVFVTGAPGLDGLNDGVCADRDRLCRSYDFDANALIALLVFHPVVQDARDAGRQARVVVDALRDRQLQGIVCTGLADDQTETPADYRAQLLLGKTRGLPMLCANPDIVVDMGEKRAYCAGALAEDYANMGGEVLYYGKPHPPIYDLARRRMGLDDPRILCIGDGIASDVQGGIAEGMDTLFITGGIAADRFGPDPANPDPALLEEWLAVQRLSPTWAMPYLA